MHKLTYHTTSWCGFSKPPVHCTELQPCKVRIIHHKHINSTSFSSELKLLIHRCSGSHVADCILTESGLDDTYIERSGTKLSATPDVSIPDVESGESFWPRANQQATVASSAPGSRGPCLAICKDELLSWACCRGSNAISCQLDALIRNMRYSNSTQAG